MRPRRYSYNTRTGKFEKFIIVIHVHSRLFNLVLYLAQPITVSVWLLFYLVFTYPESRGHDDKAELCWIPV